MPYKCWVVLPERGPKRFQIQNILVNAFRQNGRDSWPWNEYLVNIAAIFRNRRDIMSVKAFGPSTHSPVCEETMYFHTSEGKRRSDDWRQGKAKKVGSERAG